LSTKRSLLLDSPETVFCCGFSRMIPSCPRARVSSRARGNGSAQTWDPRLRLSGNCRMMPLHGALSAHVATIMYLAQILNSPLQLVLQLLFPAAPAASRFVRHEAARRQEHPAFARRIQKSSFRPKFQREQQSVSVGPRSSCGACLREETRRSRACRGSVARWLTRGLTLMRRQNYPCSLFLRWISVAAPRGVFPTTGPLPGH
jgi:hypothetical protein